MTQQQVNQKYNGKYVSFNKVYDYSKQIRIYTISKVSKVIKENMTLGQDVGTSMEYCR